MECELCISDNSTGQGTFELIKTKYDNYPQIKYRRSLDAPSLDANVNMAVSMAQAEYVWIFGDDDILNPDFLIYFKDYLKSSSPEICILNSCSFDANGVIEYSRQVLQSPRIYGSDENDSFLADQGAYITFVPCIVIRKKLWEYYHYENNIGSFFSHIQTVCGAKIGRAAHYIPQIAIRMRLHSQTWTDKHFEIWNVKFPQVIWSLDGYSENAKKKVIPRYPLNSFCRILSSRAYGRFQFEIFKSIVLPNKNCAWWVKCWAFLILWLPSDVFRILYVMYIKNGRKKRTASFSPALALAQLKVRGK